MKHKKESFLTGFPIDQRKEEATDVIRYLSEHGTPEESLIEYMGLVASNLIYHGQDYSFPEKAISFGAGLGYGLDGWEVSLEGRQATSHARINEAIRHGLEIEGRESVFISPKGIDKKRFKSTVAFFVNKRAFYVNLPL